MPGEGFCQARGRNLSRRPSPRRTGRGGILAPRVPHPSREQLNVGRFRRRDAADLALEINQAINRLAAVGGGAKINEIELRPFGVVINALGEQSDWTEVFVSGAV